LSPDSVIKDYFIIAADGKNYNTSYYNLQMIIAVGFMVNNDRAVRFRKWAGQIVKDYTIQGWTMDVDRLKKRHMFTDDYFERQLENISRNSFVVAQVLSEDYRYLHYRV
jgi:hypothetical protein